jgi:CBS domain-containing protein
MSKNPITISPDKTLKEAATIMHDRSVHRLPVLDGTDQVIGILTRGDIIRAMAASQE